MLPVLLLAITASSQLKPLPAKNLAMTCKFAQWRVLPNGGIEYTYMICTDRSGRESLWQKVADRGSQAVESESAAPKPTPATPKD